MKKIIATVAVLIVLFTGYTCLADPVDEFASHIRPLCGIVVEINYEENYIIIEDFCGNAWIWEDVDDWQVGDIVAMIMEDNNTREIFDDIILDIQYCGNLEG